MVLPFLEIYGLSFLRIILAAGPIARSRFDESLEGETPLKYIGGLIIGAVYYFLFIKNAFLAFVLLPIIVAFLVQLASLTLLRIILWILRNYDFSYDYEDIFRSTVMGYPRNRFLEILGQASIVLLLLSLTGLLSAIGFAITLQLAPSLSLFHSPAIIEINRVISVISSMGIGASLMVFIIMSIRHDIMFKDFNRGTIIRPLISLLLIGLLGVAARLLHLI